MKANKPGIRYNNEIIKISKQFWQMQDVLEKMYHKARKEKQ